MQIYDKLVRDNIPDIIRRGGGECSTRTASGSELERYLRKKLQEEVSEYLSAEGMSERAQELADILEVVHALATLEGLFCNELEGVRRRLGLGEVIELGAEFSVSVHW